MEWLSTLFLGAFFFGLLFSLASLLLGFGQHGLHFGGHGIDLHAGAGHPPGLHAATHFELSHISHGADHPSTGVSPWTVTGLTAFVAWFGGVGYLALTEFQAAAWVSLLVAALAGAAGWRLIYVVFRGLARSERVMDPADYRLEGTVARVSGAISDGRIGEIQFAKGGVRRSAGARSVDNSTLRRDAEVVIVRYEHGIAYVQPWREFVEEGAPARARES
jgi:hypothetical protein